MRFVVLIVLIAVVLYLGAGLVMDLKPKVSIHAKPNYIIDLERSNDYE